MKNERPPMTQLYCRWMEAKPAISEYLAITDFCIRADIAEVD